ncbi:hypothetical protein CSB45_14125 [candidate division KSB3 bacterium]|uniref:Tripartite tricarboxylate transporter substrate-binding protein n=1 Tax=candidate division KSB3 bacterium TaxID=2044937 RepID=A0A2G6E172_9BACT|nr:MAG: hypothetical protein CSB45_14125 [candidate division KSB3 bacterium]PIE28463.1 MAG: hypothetical protein CSA57_13770 [candidate division KSB3 bacterium]
MKRSAIILSVAAFTLFAMSIFPGLLGQAFAEYPDRPITIIVPWGAGGGTDTIIRIFAIGFEQEMGVPVNVVNRTGGNGVVGHTAIASAKPDGYTLGAGTSEITYFSTLNLAPLTPDSFDLISRLAAIPAGVTVKADSPFKDLNDMLESVRQNSKDTYSASGSGLGGPWHMAIAGLEKAAGIETDRIQWIPSQGGAPALQDLIAEGITFFTGSPIEAKSLLAAGEVRVLAIMSEERSPAFPDVPTVKEAAGLEWTLANWFSLIAPKGLPEDVKVKIVAAAQKAHADSKVQEALAQRGITPLWDGPEGFKAFADEFTVTAANLLKELGVAK